MVWVQVPKGETYEGMERNVNILSFMFHFLGLLCIMKAVGGPVSPCVDGSTRLDSSAHPQDQEWLLIPPVGKRDIQIFTSIRPINN